MSDNKIVEMGEATGRGDLRSVESALRDAISTIGKEGALKAGKKVLILGLDDTDGQFSIGWFQAGMKMSECLALCEAAKTQFLKEMDYL